MGQGWCCPMCEEVLSLPRFEAGMCAVVPRDPECPLRPREPLAAAPTAPLTPSDGEAAEP